MKSRQDPHIGLYIQNLIRYDPMMLLTITHFAGTYEHKNNFILTLKAITANTHLSLHEFQCWESWTFGTWDHTEEVLSACHLYMDLHLLLMFEVPTPTRIQGVLEQYRQCSYSILTHKNPWTELWSHPGPARSNA